MKFFLILATIAVVSVCALGFSKPTLDHNIGKVEASAKEEAIQQLQK